MTKKPDGEQESPSAMQFPCDFSIKVMGRTSLDFPKLVETIVREHFPNFKEENIQKRYSQFTNYMSLTVEVHAENQVQLDNLYRHLTSTPGILIVL